MSNYLIIKPDACIGCRSCELICSFKRTDRFSPQSSAVTVYEFTGKLRAVPLMCMHCDEPECIRACSTDALYRDELTGAVVINFGKCILCGKCVVACPLGNIHRDLTQNRMVKCDLCGGKPKCVQVCPVGAIEFNKSCEIERS